MLFDIFINDLTEIFHEKCFPGMVGKYPGSVLEKKVDRGAQLIFWV